MGRSESWFAPMRLLLPGAEALSHHCALTVTLVVRSSTAKPAMRRHVPPQDKVNMTVAVIPIAQELGWSSTVTGLVQSSFFCGFMLAQVSH